MTEDRNGGPSGSPERLVTPIKTWLADGTWGQPHRRQVEAARFLKMIAGHNEIAYVCQFARPDGWGVCFVHHTGDFFKYYPDQETAEVAAMLEAS